MAFGTQVKGAGKIGPSTTEKQLATSADQFVARLRNAAEAILIVLACGTPWIFGGVDDRTQLVVAALIAFLAVLGVAIGWKTPRLRYFLCLPSLVLVALAALALFQATELPAELLKKLAPTTYSLITELSPSSPYGVTGSSEGPVALPALTLSQDADASLHTAFQLVAAWIIFQTALLIGRDYGVLRRFGTAVAINATFMTLFAITQSLTWNGMIFGIRPSPIKDGWYTGGPFVGHSHLAAYLNVGLGFALGFVLALGPKQLKRVFSMTDERPGPIAKQFWPAFAMGVIAVGVISSHSRGGFLSMIGSALVTLVVFKPRSVKLGWGALLVLVFIPIFLVAVGYESSFKRVATIADAYETGAGGRTDVWEPVLKIWRTYPVWGTGLGAFAVATAPYTGLDRRRYYAHAENEYLEYLEEGGVIAIVLIAVGIIAIARLAWRARNAAPTDQDRCIVVGALFGGLSLLIESMGDFALHIPGVAILGVILTAYLCRLGLDARRQNEADAPQQPGRVNVASVAIGLVVLALSFAVVAHGYPYARVEEVMVNAGFPRAVMGMPVTYMQEITDEELDARLEAAELAVKVRPEWSGGHVWLGLTRLALFHHTQLQGFQVDKAAADAAAKEEVRLPTSVARQLRDAKKKKNAANQAEPTDEELDEFLMSDPLWLHEVFHTKDPKFVTARAEIIGSEAVKLDLVPAAYSFLQARRCCPVLPTPHAYLGMLDYLLDGGEPGPVHARRTLRLAGATSLLTSIAAQVAFDCGDRELGAACWKHQLACMDWGWGPLADASASLFKPSEILEKVLPENARYPILFADYLYMAPDLKEPRELFLKTGLERIASDKSLSAAEKVWLEGHARACLDDRAKARVLLKKAVELEPKNGEWWVDYVYWLIVWGDAKEARLQADVGLYNTNGYYGLKNIYRQTIEALANPQTSDDEESPEQPNAAPEKPPTAGSAPKVPAKSK